MSPSIDSTDSDPSSKLAELSLENPSSLPTSTAENTAMPAAIMKASAQDNMATNAPEDGERLSLPAAEPHPAPHVVSKKDKFLKETSQKPSDSPQLRHAKQLEIEIEYPDMDNSVAHGQVEKDSSGKTIRKAVPATGLTRNRSTGKIDQDRGRPITDEDRELHKRRRRGSVDEKVSAPRRFFIDVEETKRIILAQEDTDGDFQITVQDSGPKSFQLGSANSGGFRKYDIRGTYMLSNLLQELALASDYGRKYIVLDEERLRENPVERMTRLIKFHFWDGLTRRIDAEGLELICNDPKGNPNDKVSRVYVPYHDKYAFDYYTEVAKTRPHLNIGVIRLPEIITPQYVKSLNRTPGILSLMLREQTDPNTKQKIIRGVPFVVPGGRFNEMYGWDSYFEALGLLVDGRVELARGMVDNFCYCIEHYGKILNANRSYYLTRSQPPFLTDMTLEVYRHLRTKPATWNPPNLSAWLSQSFRGSVKELLSIWLASPRLDAVVGLSKFHPEGIGMPPETESTHFNHILEPFAERMGIDLETYKEMYATDQIKEPELDAYFVHDRAVRESGHDTTYRFEKRCANLATIDLNALVFKYEVDIARVLIEQFGGSIKLRVRRGPGDIYLNGFLEWVKLLREKGVDGSVGNNGGWNTLWAKGIIVLDEMLDNEVRRQIHNQVNAMANAGYRMDVQDYTGQAAGPAITAAHFMKVSYPEEEKYLYSPPLPDPPYDPTFPTYIILNDANYSVANGTTSENPNAGAFYVRLPAGLFLQLSNRTRQLVNQYLWNPTEHLFYDYDCKEQEPSAYETVTTFYALWSGLATEEQARHMVPKALDLFEVKGGLVSGTEESRGRVGLDRPNRQWDFPYGWAPHQILGWSGMVRYGFVDDARRVAYRWLYMISKSFVDFNGVVPEKFDVVNMTHKVNVEYGNVGADFKFVVREGFGWMNASFEVGVSYLTRNLRRALGALTPPDRLFDSAGALLLSPNGGLLEPFGVRRRSVSRDKLSDGSGSLGRRSLARRGSGSARVRDETDESESGTLGRGRPSAPARRKVDVSTTAVQTSDSDEETEGTGSGTRTETTVMTTESHEERRSVVDGGGQGGVKTQRSWAQWAQVLVQTRTASGHVGSGDGLVATRTMTTVASGSPAVPVAGYRSVGLMAGLRNVVGRNTPAQSNENVRR